MTRRIAEPPCPPVDLPVAMLNEAAAGTQCERAAAKVIEDRTKSVSLWSGVGRGGLPVCGFGLSAGRLFAGLEDVLDLHPHVGLRVALQPAVVLPAAELLGHRLLPGQLDDLGEDPRPGDERLTDQRLGAVCTSSTFASSICWPGCTSR